MIAGERWENYKETETGKKKTTSLMQMKGRQEAGDRWQSRVERLQERNMGEYTGRQVTGCKNGMSTVL